MSAPTGQTEQLTPVEDSGLTFGDLGAAWRRDRWRIVAGAVTAGAMALGYTYLIAPTFTASTTFIPPQQAQSTAAAALASLGSLANLAGGSNIKSPSDQFVSIMQSATVSDRIIDRFELMSAFEAKFRVDARRALADRVRMSVGKKDGLITVEVDDTIPDRAAKIANQYVDELRRMSGSLAISEAQQRRAFFEQQLAKSKDRLTAAQTALQSSGFDPSALKTEPKATAESFSRLMAEAAAAEVRLQALKSSLADSTPEVKQQVAILATLRARLASAERATDSGAGPDYVSRYRDFKYQETLFEIYARQFELARADESREGALLQVIDVATPPERKSKPRRSMFVLTSTLAAAFVLMAWSTVNHLRRRPRP